MISVVIPTFNAGRYIHGLLSSIKSQTVLCETVIIDSSSTDNTVSVSESFGAKVVSIKKEDFNHGRARNLAASHTRGDFIVFLTQDALPFDVHCIERLVASVEGDIAACYGRQIPMDSAKPTEKFTRYYNYPETKAVRGLGDTSVYGIRTFFFSNVFSVVRRYEFELLGGFPEDLIMFEDMLFAAKLMMKGCRIAYSPDAKVIHSHNYSLRQQFIRYLEAGISFSNNPWFLEQAKADKEGVAFLKEEFKFFVREHKAYWIIYGIIEALYKYTGYKLGLSYSKFPSFLFKGVIRTHA
ncbi:MAG: glycosyltransferase family 2 protein [Syntrophus sp. (in: bacteria)]|nr:glycosyltransferase family 2 protein [Syntrophus sp. (in: bacteria)]